MRDHQPTRDTLIDQAWDDEFLGTDADGDHAAIEPELIETIRRIHALDAAPAADPLFVTNLWEKLMHTQQATFTAPSPFAPILGDPIPRPREASPLPPRSLRRPWSLASASLAFAAVAILLIGLWRSDLRPGTPGFLSRSHDGPSIAAPSTPVAGPFEVAWQVPGGDTGFDFPTSLAVDPDGNIWVADSGNDRFQIFSPGGDFIETWGVSGTGDGQFRMERFNGDGYGVNAFLSDGSFVALDPGNHRIQYFAADRTFVKAVGTVGTSDGQFQDPVGLAVGADDTVLVLDDKRADVQVFNSSGAFIRKIALQTRYSDYNTMNSLTVDTAGNLYVTELSHDGQFVVERFDKDGNATLAIDSADLVDQPQAVAVDAAGTIYILQWSQKKPILVVDASGMPVMTIAPTADQPKVPWTSAGMVLDSKGNLYVSDTTSRTLTKIRLGPPLWPPR